jgi:hypothetical protein
MNTEYMNLPQLLTHDNGVVILATSFGIARNSIRGKVLIAGGKYERCELVTIETTGFALYRKEVVLEDGTLLKNTLKWADK